MKRVVVMGGGTGQAALLRGLKQIETLHLSAIVTVTDDGGSTGRLREEFNVPAMGDIRNVMIALSESDNLSQIMKYRFKNDSSSALAGHNVGNLILTALTETTGSFMEAVLSLSAVMHVGGDIIPASTDFVTLCARMNDGTIVRGESNIPIYKNNVQEVYYDKEVHATPEAIAAVLEADMIVFGVGSLYTSILPNIIIEDLRQAILASKAKRIYYCNSMTQPGETDGYSGEDHVTAIEKHLQASLDCVVYNTDIIPDTLLKQYREEGSVPVTFSETAHAYQLVGHSLIASDSQQIRHNPDKVRTSFLKIMEIYDVIQ